MCAPCKIVLDDGTKAAALGGGPEQIMAAMAESAKELAREGRLPDQLLNRLSRIDSRFLRGRLEEESPAMSCTEWIAETIRAFREEFKVEGI